MKKEVKKSQLIAKTNGDRIRLQAFQEGLVPCSVEERKEELWISYHLENLYPFSEVKKELPVNIVKALINIAKLFELSKEYLIDLSPSNMYYDMNFLPKMLERDICNEDIYTDYEDFIMQYKSLIACTLQHRYKFEDYYLGGLDLMKKDSNLKEIHSSTNVEEIVELLKREYEKESSNLYIKSVIIRKNKLLVHWIVETIAIIGVLILGGISGYAHLVSMPNQEKLLEADNHFIHQEYDKVITVLNTTSLNQIPISSKYMLVQSYYNTNKNLFDQSKAVDSDISLTSDTNRYHYWIQLYQGKFVDAIDTAKKIQNNEYLLYAYTQQYKHVAEDTNLDGEDKQTQLDTIKSSMKGLEDDMKEESEKGKNPVTNSK